MDSCIPDYLPTILYKIKIGRTPTYTDCISPFDLDRTKSELERMYPGKAIKIKPCSLKTDITIKIQDVLKLKMDLFDGNSTGGDKSA